jgi:hypothetical protein
MSENEKIVDLPIGGTMAGQLPVQVEGGWQAPCYHHYGTINVKARELRCSECGALLDPFDFLHRWANRLKNRQHGQMELVKGLDQVRVHSLGLADSLTLCGVGSKTKGFRRPYTVRVSTDPKRIDCRQCLEKLSQGRPAVLAPE